MCVYLLPSYFLLQSVFQHCDLNFSSCSLFSTFTVRSLFVILFFSCLFDFTCSYLSLVELSVNLSFFCFLLCSLFPTSFSFSYPLCSIFSTIFTLDAETKMSAEATRSYGICLNFTFLLSHWSLLLFSFNVVRESTVFYFPFWRFFNLYSLP